MCRGDLMCSNVAADKVPPPPISSWKTVQNVCFCNEKYSRTFALDVLIANTAIRHGFLNKNTGDFMCRGDFMCNDKRKTHIFESAKEQCSE